MLVTPIDLGLDLAPHDTTRPTGLHMSDIYNDMYRLLDPKRYAADMVEDRALLGIGLALEQYTERLLVAQGFEAHRPPPFQNEDGVWFSPDLLVQRNGLLLGGEIKATFKSMRGIPEQPGDVFAPKFDKYLTQMKLYGHNLRIPDWLLLVWFIKGDYEKRGGSYFAQFRAFQLSFTDFEMAEEYATAKNFAQGRGWLPR